MLEDALPIALSDSRPVVGDADRVDVGAGLAVSRFGIGCRDHQSDIVGYGRQPLQACGEILGWPPPNRNADPVDLVLLDLGLPDLEGRVVCQEIRASSNVPIIVVTARSDEIDRVVLLELGADDYVVKPFSPRELLARIRAVTRRSSAVDEGGRLNEGNLTLDTISRRVLGGDGEELHMGPTEYRLLEFFMSHPGRAYSRSQILDHVWGANAYLEERTVDVHIRRLRKALEPAAASGYLQTVRGHGYRFLSDD